MREDITKIVLSANEINDAQADALADILERNMDTEEMVRLWNNLGDDCKIYDMHRYEILELGKDMTKEELVTMMLNDDFRTSDYYFWVNKYGKWESFSEFDEYNSAFSSYDLAERIMDAPPSKRKIVPLGIQGDMSISFSDAVGRAYDLELNEDDIESLYEFDALNKWSDIAALWLKMRGIEVEEV